MFTLKDSECCSALAEEETAPLSVERTVLTPDLGEGSRQGMQTVESHENASGAVCEVLRPSRQSHVQPSVSHCIEGFSDRDRTRRTS